MAFKMNKNNVNFGEGTGSSPNKFSPNVNSKMLRMQADAMDRMRRPLLDALGQNDQSDNVATPNDGSNMGDMVGDLFTQENLDAVRNQSRGQGQRIDIPVDGGSDTVEGGNKQYASGFGPQGGMAGLIAGIQNLLNQAGSNQ